jgi:hypothetical protein
LGGREVEVGSRETSFEVGIWRWEVKEGRKFKSQGERIRAGMEVGRQ